MSKKKIKRIAQVISVVSFILVIMLSIFVHFHPVMNFDVSFSKKLQSNNLFLHNEWIEDILIAVSWIGRTSVAAWIVIGFALMFWLLKYYWENLFCLLTLLSAAINSLIKIIINRPRPSANFVHIFDHEISPSFPSGHVVFYTVFFGYLFAAMFFTERIPKILRVIIQIVSLILIVLVSFSRVYLGAHWATDVLGGYLLGFALLNILLYFYLKNYIDKN